jgi:hypothetical protein
MESYLFSATQLHRIGTRSRDWLWELQHHSHPGSQFTIRHAFQILLGLWICEQGLLENTEPSSTRLYAYEVGQYIPEDADDVADLFSSDPTLALFALGILRFFNIHNSQLELFAVHLSRLLQGYCDQDDLEANELFLTRFLLQRLHLHSPLPPYSLKEFSTCDLVNADDITIGNVVKNITAATQYGQAMPTTKKDFLQALSSFLPVFMLNYFRLYNLEIGMQILRALRYLQPGKDRGLETGLKFLVAQQQHNGRFGFFAHEMAQLHISEAKYEQDFKLYLPLTVSFVWTIAETAHSQFILAQSF